MSFALGPFTPATDSTVNVAATTTTGNVALPVVARDQIVVTNAPGGSMAFIEFGNSTVEADAATSMPILPGTAYTLTVSRDATHMAAVTGTGTATVYATPGQGA